MTHRLRPTLTSLVLAAAFLIGSATVGQAATVKPNQSPAAAGTAGFGTLWSVVWEQLSAALISNTSSHFSAKHPEQQRPGRGLHLLIDEGLMINPNGGK